MSGPTLSRVGGVRGPRRGVAMAAASVVRAQED
jgi:hypothetical protein